MLDDVEKLLRTTADELEKMLSGKTVMGEPITIGDTTVTLGQTEEKDAPWQPFNRSFGDNEDFGAREDKVRGKEGGSNPLTFQCYADGCY